MFRFQSINHVRSKIKETLSIIDRKDVYVSGIIILVAITSYILGALSVLNEVRKPITIEQFELGKPPIDPTISGTQTNSPISTDSSKKVYVGSKNGTKYHLGTCSGAKTIAPANQVWFTTKEEAEKNGYTKAGNCPGI